jgi:shikimate dehydrogenase
MSVTYGLLGKKLSHSFSKKFFEDKFSALGFTDHRYVNIELDEIDKLRSALAEYPDLKGFNVTVPYKHAVIPQLDGLSDVARKVQAVNCIKVDDGGGLHGYNTDVFGFMQSIKPFLDHGHQRALILGTGGAAKAVAYGLGRFNLEIFFVTRGKKPADNYLIYSEVNSFVMGACKLIVNATPVGMFPDVHACPELPYHLFTPEHLAYDLVYNPPLTGFLQKASEHGAVTVNGLSMLHWQAEKSWEIWGGELGDSI